MHHDRTREAEKGIRPSRRNRRLSVFALAVCLLTAGVIALSGAETGYDVQNTSATINGPVSVSTADDDAIGVQVAADRGEAVTVAVKGSILAEAVTDHYDHQGSTGMYVNVSGEGSAGKVTVDGEITALNTWKGDNPYNLDTAGLEADVADGGDADVTVNGRILARAMMKEDEGYTWSAGLHSGNTGGTLKVTVNGGVTAEATVYGVGLNMKIDAEGEASSFVRVNGDVTAKDIGIRAENSAPDGTMEVLVDGTLSAERCIQPEGDTPRKSRFTIWKAAPLNGGAIVPPFEDIGISEEDARAVEKEIRYILRTDAESAQYLTVSAEDYRGYKVAREGETVLVQVHAPDGLEVAAVYGMPGNKMPLAEAEGGYALTVPKGGGIELSVSLKKAVPATGDPSPLLFWAGLALLGLAGLSAAGTEGSRRKNG